MTISEALRKQNPARKSADASGDAPGAPSQNGGEGAAAEGVTVEGEGSGEAHSNGSLTLTAFGESSTEDYQELKAFSDLSLDRCCCTVLYCTVQDLQALVPATDSLCTCRKRAQPARQCCVSPARAFLTPAP